MKMTLVVAAVVSLAVGAAFRSGWFVSETASGLDSHPEQALQNPAGSKAAVPRIPSFVAPQQPQELETALAPDSSRNVPAADLPILLRAAGGAEQRAALADGVITADEFRAAWSAAHTCAVDAAAGYPGVVFEPLQGDVGAMSFGMSAPTKELLATANAIQSRCLDEHARSIVTGWDLAASEARMSRIATAVGACMSSHGAAVGDGANWEALIAVSKATVGSRALYDQCRPRVPE